MVWLLSGVVLVEGKLPLSLPRIRLRIPFNEVVCNEIDCDDGMDGRDHDDDDDGPSTASGVSKAFVVMRVDDCDMMVAVVLLKSGGVTTSGREVDSNDGGMLLITGGVML
jgi:hypothetical protein